ncbi:nucleoporin Nup120/160-domain-containing protein [Bisporella sp. PMI_857]|nr:nucleoporin Nup120/160-domain-containing protein [Bisporella sp. PMI_857]
MASYFAYKETRLHLDTSTQGSTIHFRLPGTSRTKGTQKRPLVAEIPLAEDENAFRQKHLATAASIYHRQYHKSPKSFLWRVLEDGKVLSIRSVDLSRHTNTPAANLTLRLSFPSSIRPGCVAFADSEEHDVLSVFVLLESHHLYTFALRPDYFRKVSSTEDNVTEWCKIYTASAFGIGHKAPHRLAALSPDELLISQYNGELLRLMKRSGTDGSEWTATQHSEGSLSLRSMIRWGGAPTHMKYGSGNIEFAAATSIATPSVMIDGISYAFMVSLDHKLRVWNFQTGKIVYAGDILNQDLETSEAPKQVIHPSYSQLVKVYGHSSEESALCVTYSPLGTGEFKFWNVQAAPGGELQVTDYFPNNKLEPQTPTSDLWTLADFAVIESLDTYDVWVLWKNNITYRVQNLTFSSNSSVKNVRESWKFGWTIMAQESLREASFPRIIPGDPADMTDKWLQFILTPGKFTAATIETGLAIYERGIGESKETSRKAGSLPERMCAIIASTVHLNQESGSIQYDQFRLATEEQWHRFYRLLLELDKQRGEALSLSVDPQDGMPWVVLADGITAVRACSSFELLWHNQTQEIGSRGSPKILNRETEVLVPLLKAAAGFRRSLSDQILQTCITGLRGELFEEASLIDPVRLTALYDKFDFANQISDEEFEHLRLNLGGSFKYVTLEIFQALFRLMTKNEEPMVQQHLLPMSEFGNKLVVKGVQETVELLRNVCLDQLILLILIESEVNHNEDGIGFDTAAVFRDLLTNFKRLELINWLATTQISLPLPKDRSSFPGEQSDVIVKTATPIVETVTVLEGVLRHLYGHDIKRKESMMEMITEILIQICDPESKYEVQPSLTQCFLLRNGRHDLALEFSRFTLQNPFDIYVQGRAFLSANDASAASRLFKKAAYGIGVPDRHKRADFRSAGYLDETERNLLNAGLPQYYSHIVALYEREKIYSFVIDFARLALQFLKPGTEDVSIKQLRTEMHSRLFNAAVQTSRYDLAHSTISLFTDAAIQHSSLRTLISKMCETSHVSQLISLPFISLQDAVDEILAQKCHSIVDVTAGIPYHKILYAWRVKRNDFRGAAAVSLERLQRLQAFGDDSGLEQQYVALINALSCVDPKHAWILSEEPPIKKTTGGVKNEKPKRRVVTLNDVRKEYQAELDRVAAIENNQFTFTGADAMDVDIL